MPSVTFPNGQTLTSAALTPDQVNVIFQPLIAEMLGLDPVHNPNAAYSAVRVGWQQQGEPAWAISEDVCILRSTLVDHPYARVRDNLDAPNNATSIRQDMAFTQVWNIHLTLYGPNSAGLARQILSAVTLDWVHDALVPSNLYLIPGLSRPTYNPENFEGQWWKRADIDLRYNELALESIAVDSAAGVNVTVVTDSNISESFEISVP